MITSIIDSEGKEVSDKSIISKTINEFFVNIGPNMDAKIPLSRNFLVYQVLLIHLLMNQSQMMKYICNLVSSTQGKPADLTIYLTNF